ncbi:phage tail protein [Streptomyces sp. NPDC005374]|uniref:phage tail protein n=1 Tax=Streptomyces sp. NPDC005374 TaxID=3364713 RepID=UPI003676E40B
MALREESPYGAFNFLVKLGDNWDDAALIGGFSDVSGLGNEVKYSEYRGGNDRDNHVRKVANTNTTDDVTLKRGLIGDTRLFEWLAATREGRFEPRTVIISLQDESRAGTVCRWKLEAAQPKKWVGPTLAGKGGGEVAMEELQLVAESIVFTSP